MGDERTVNTLFMLSSVDGKISTGETDKRDFDKDLKNIFGLKEGLSQYYGLEQKTDLHSFNSGRVMAKVGWNNPKRKTLRLPVSFILIDSTHLTSIGIKNLLASVKDLYLVTTNAKHPAFKIKSKNLHVLLYQKKINFKELFKKLRLEHNIKKVTIQSGGTLNSILLREQLIDKVSLVICPALVGGVNTPSLIGGESLQTEKELRKVGVLKLVKVNLLKDSYLHLLYDVLR